MDTSVASAATATAAAKQMSIFAEGITIAAPTIIGAFVALAGAVATMFKLYADAKNRQIAELESTKKSWEEMAMEGIKSAKETADFYRGKYESKAPILLAAPVISESHSPSTKVQREAAKVATARASLAAIKLSMGQSPRLEPEHKKE